MNNSKFMRHFEGTPVEEAFKTLLAMGWRKSEFALSGSAGLHFLSTTALNRGFEPLIGRQPHDIDIIVMGDARRMALDKGIVTPSWLGCGQLISLQLAENKGSLLDITTDWPIGGKLETLQDLRNATEEVDGIQVLNPRRILELKAQFDRVKDRPDIASATRVLHSDRPRSGYIAPLKP